MFLIGGVICAIICGFIASSKGRNVVGWVVLGFLFGLIPLIIVACLPNLAQQRERERYVDEENRRLREQLRQEQIKGETFRQHAAARLDAHDQHLNLDTRTLGPSLAAGDNAVAQLGTASGNGIGTAWYYAMEGRTCGPVSAAEIFDMIRRRKVTSNTMVWAEHLTEWQLAGRTAPFQSEFTSSSFNS